MQQDEFWQATEDDTCRTPARAVTAVAVDRTHSQRALGLSVAAVLLVLLNGGGRRPAFAGVGVGVAPTYPAVIQVGAINVPVGLSISNTSTGAEAGGTLTLNLIRQTPSCGSDTPIPCPAASLDMDVFVVKGPAIGRTGTACAGTPFSIGTPDTVTGEVEFTPSASIVLGPVGTGALSRCTIDFFVDALKIPTYDASDSPGIQTNVLGRVRAVASVNAVQGTGTGSGVITVVVPTPTPTPTARRPLGNPCDDAGQCSSGFCVDNQCCSTQCQVGQFCIHGVCTAATPTLTPTPTPTANPIPTCVCTPADLIPGTSRAAGGAAGKPSLDDARMGIQAGIDCLSELCVCPPGPRLSNGLPDNSRVCSRDDPTCDATLGDNACTFTLRICFNLRSNEDRFVCSTDGPVTEVRLNNPRAGAPRTAVDQENITAFETALANLGGKVGGFNRRSMMFNPALPDEVCTDTIPFKVMLRQNTRTLRLSPRKFSLNYFVYSASGVVDVDRMSYRCNP